MDTFTTPELLACIAREVALRESCYPKWAKTTLEALPAGKRKEIDMMRAVSEHLTALAQDNARLVDETHRWSEAVKKLEAERGATWISRKDQLPDTKITRLLAWHTGVDDDTWPIAPHAMLMDARQFINNPGIYSHWRPYAIAAPKPTTDGSNQEAVPER